MHANAKDKIITATQRLVEQPVGAGVSVSLHTGTIINHSLDCGNCGVLNVQPCAWCAVCQVEAGIVGKHVAGQVASGCAATDVRNWCNNVSTTEVVQLKR